MIFLKQITNAYIKLYELRFPLIWRLEKVLRNILKKNWKSDVIERGGLKWLISDLNIDVENALLLNYKYDNETFEFVKEKVKDGDVCVDIGANVGFFTVHLANIVGTKGKVYAFEPSPIHSKKLKTNIELNGFKNVILSTKAIGKNKGQISHFSSVTSGSLNPKLVINPSEAIETLVEISPLYSEINESDINKIKIIKIDVDGSEMDVLKGADSILSKTNAYLIIEIWETGINEVGEKLEEIIEYILSFNYKVYINKRLESNSKKICDYIRANPPYLDIFCSKGNE